MIKIKKYLISSLILGLAGISIVAVAASCANAAENNNPDPASQNSLATNPGDPLTKEQMEYHKKMANEIKTQFDANAGLDYSNPEDKTKIDNQITKYQNEINNGSLKQLIAKIKSESLQKESNDQEPFSNTVSDFYNNFNQKNLIPTETEIKEYSSANNPDTNNNWKISSGLIAIFYKDPKNLILLVQLLSKVGQENISKISEVDLEIISVSFGTTKEVNNFYEFFKDKKENSSAYQIVNFYSYFFNKLNDFLSPSQTPTEINSNPGV